MRILISGTTYSPARNGQAVFTTHLAEGLARCGHQVMVLGQSEWGHPYRAVRNGVLIFAARSLSLARWNPGTAACLVPGPSAWQAMEAFRPEVVHIQDHYPISRFALRYARSRGLKTLGTNHFMPENLAPYLGALAGWQPVYGRLMWGWVLEVFNRLDLVTAPSRTAVEILRGQGLRPQAVPISCGIDLDRFHPDPCVDRQAALQRYGLDPDRRVFLFVGRVDGEKRLDVLLHAVSLLERDDIQLAIAGKGAALENLHALARALDLGDRVRFTGFIPDPDLPALLNSADFFAMPSQAELLSIATLEAMACARPVLLARSQALPELVSDGMNGFTFEPGDPQDAARKIDLLVGQPQRWTGMGAASLARAQAHSLEHVLQRYAELYTVLAEPARPRLGSPAWPFPARKLHPM
jgi:glycosyltransferase involved in cell wall biosynthesis